MISMILMHKIAELTLILLLGFILVKLNVLKEKDSVVFSKLNLYLIMPLAIFNAFLTQHSQDAYVGILITFLGAAVVHLILLVMVLLGKRFLHMDAVEQGSVMYPNSGNLMIPIVAAALGEEWVLYTSPFMIYQTLLIYTQGVHFFVPQEPIRLKKVLLIPSVWAVSFGCVFFVTGIQLPDLVMECISDLGNMVGPFSMLIIGMSLASVKLKEVLGNKRLYLILAARLILSPLLFLLLLLVTGVTARIPNGKEMLLITFLAASAPAAATVTQFAQLYDGDAKYASAINIISTLLCVLTMPAFVWLYETLL